MLVGIAPGDDEVPVQQMLQGAMQRLFADAQDVLKRAHRDIRLARDDVQDAMMDPRKPERRQIRVGLFRHSAPAEKHQFEGGIEFVNFHKPGLMGGCAAAFCDHLGSISPAAAASTRSILIAKASGRGYAEQIGFILPLVGGGFGR